MLHTPGFDCSRCDDATKDERGCRKPREGGRAFTEPDAEGCPVEEVAPWYFVLCDELRARKQGLLRSTPHARRAAELMVLQHAQDVAVEALRARMAMMERQRANSAAAATQGA